MLFTTSDKEVRKYYELNEKDIYKWAKCWRHAHTHIYKTRWNGTKKINGKDHQQRMYNEVVRHTHISILCEGFHDTNLNIHGQKHWTIECGSNGNAFCRFPVNE